MGGEKAMTADETMIFKRYCAIDTNIMNGGHNVVSAPNMSRLLGWSLYKTRKVIKGLVNNGFLISGEEGGYDYDNDIVYCYRGYYITSKGRDSLIYKKELWKDCKACSEIFGGGSPYSYWEARKPRRRT